MSKTSFRMKHRGASLLMIVLSGFLILSMLSAIAINVASQITHNEIWRGKGTMTSRLTHIARSTASTVAEAIILEPEYFGDAAAIENGVFSEKTTVIDDPETGILNEVEVKIQGVLSIVVFVTVTAYEQDKYRGVTARIDMKATPKTVRWSIKK
ncbi:MAG: hypothetical protein GXZ13_00650 [Synergistaceae bacterium]|nr:hypothetical protein [Synergistaceae bacterium]